MVRFHFSYIGGVERAEKNITLLNLQKIADAFQVNVHELFHYSKYVKAENNDKEKLLNEINEKVRPMKSSDLKKVNLLLSELFDN
nr:helix-turn-helix transcriptional regulator [Paenibacillus xylanexedens]